MASVNLTFLPASPISETVKHLHAPNSSEYIFRTLSKSIKQHPFFKNLGKNKIKVSQADPKGEKQIKLKMFIKVANWMEKLAIQTLSFSQDTLQISIRTLRLYLELSQESPKQLQMIGCICLHLASKMNQRTIVSVQSYRECCMNIFTNEEFQEKQAEVYDKIWDVMPSETFVKLSDLIQYEFFNNLDENKKVILKSVIKMISKDEDLLGKQPMSVVINLWAKIIQEDQFVYNPVEFLKEVECRKFQY